MRARVKNKIVFLLVVGILSFMPCLIVINSSQVIKSTSEKAPPSVKTSSIEEIVRIVDEFQVNDYMEVSQYEPSICALSNESFAVAWSSYGEGIYAAVIDATTGKNTTSEIQVSSYPTYNFVGTSTCALSSDSFAVAWSGEGQGDDSGVFATVIDATTGNNITAEFRLNNYTAGGQKAPSLCTLSSDTLAAVWESDGQDGDWWGVYGSVFNATTGNNITAEFLVNDFTNDTQTSPSICAISSDLFAVAWTSRGQQYPSEGIYAKVINATTGKNTTAEFRVHQINAINQNFPSISAFSSDSFAVAWQVYGADGDEWGVYGRTFNATTGTKLTAEFRVNNYTTSNQDEPSICSLSSDALTVSWTSLGQDGDKEGVYATVINATTGKNLTVEFQVNQYTDDEQDYSTICALSSDSFAVVWQSYDEGGSNPDIFATVFGQYSGNDDSGGPPDFGILILIGIAVVAGVAATIGISAIIIRKKK